MKGWEDEPPSDEDDDPSGAPGYHVPFRPKAFFPITCPWCDKEALSRPDGLHYCDPCGKAFWLHLDVFAWRIPLHDGDSPDRERSKPDKAA